MIQTIQTFVERELLSGRTVGPDDDLLLSGLVDSLGVMRLVAFIEQTFGFKVHAREVKLANFATLSSIVAYVETRSAA